MKMLPIRFDGQVFVPQEPVNLTPGELFHLAVEENSATTDQNASSTLADLAEWASQLSPSEMPTDGAAQHDHYLHGTPKRTNP